MSFKVKKRLRSAPEPVPAAFEAVVGELPPPTRLARQLALAYRVERAIEAGELADYAAAAKALGVTRARMSQIAALRWLAVGVQEAVLRGEVVGGERELRCQSLAHWPSQDWSFRFSTPAQDEPE